MAFFEKNRLQQLAEADPRFRMRVAGRGPLCPYCLGLVPSGAGEDALVKHILKGCQSYKDAQSPIQGLAAMQQKKRFLELRDLVGGNPAWRVTDKQRRWFCPCCREPTRIVLGAEAEGDGQLALAILPHLSSCVRFLQDPGCAASPEEMKTILEGYGREARLADMVRRKVQAGEEILLQRTGDDEWICPYCLQAVPSVPMRSEIERKNSAPPCIARHFLNNCKEFHAHAQTRTLDEVRGRVAALDREAAARRPAKAETEDDRLESIRREVQQLKQAIQQNKELADSLQRARHVVEAMLPKKLPRPEGYELAVHYQSCAEVGGDFYDFVHLQDGRLGISVGDVSGHGLEAALVMGMTRKALNMRARAIASPAEVLKQANSDILPDVDDSVFVTCFYGVLDPRAHRLDFARAGHTYSLVYRRGTGAVETIRSRGIVLGMSMGPLFDRIIEPASCRLEPGDVFIQYSDGIVEAHNPDKVEFGLERFQEALRRFAPIDADHLVRNTLAVLSKFMRGQAPQDDVTLLAVRRLPA